MTITLNKQLADAICTVITMGFLDKEKNTIFIYNDAREERAYASLKQKLQRFGINVNFAYKEGKIEESLVLAKTKMLVGDTGQLIQDFVNKLSKLSDLKANDQKKLKFYGAYIGGCLTPHSSIEFSGASGLKLYKRPSLDKNDEWLISGLDNETVEKSFQAAKKTTDEINEHLEKNISTYNSQSKTKFTYNKSCCSETPDNFTENDLFGSIHGLVRVMIEYNLTPNGIGSGKDQTCCELALSSDTDKVGSCIPCSIFASSNRTPANYTHLGRGDNWNFPDTVKSPNKHALPEKRRAWEAYVNECFSIGFTKLTEKSLTAKVSDLSAVKQLNDAAKIADIFLHSLTFEGKFSDRILNTFAVLEE